MAHTCSKCSRINPDEAVYCYHDGIALNGHGRAGGPVSVGSQSFPTPFIFPSGRACRSFDELATACQEDWNAARDLLLQGFLGSFFGGLGRADLALAADEAKHFPDHDRGLDQLLAKLPTQVLGEPQLRVEPQEINLGTLTPGQERTFELHLENQGLRLLYGTVTCEDCPWLALGDHPGTPQKIFQFGHETTVPVHIQVKRVRAGNKPLEGKLVIESNGGDILVTVRAEVPIAPYPGDGVLAGARSPRQLAEKAKLKPKEAALLFENGDVAAWYKSNGWTYPVQGPAATGVGAVQQFFEALGLTPAPRVQISDRAVALQGSVGDNNLRHVLEIKTEEKKPVYAHGTSNVSWLEVSRPKLNGRVATITLTVPTVPNKPGETLTGKVTVQSNGNQRFSVPVTLQIGHNLDFTSDAPAPVPVFEIDPEPIPIEAGTPLPQAIAQAPQAIQLPPPLLPRLRRQQAKPNWIHAVPAALLALALLLVVILDLTRGNAPDEGAGGPEPPATMTALYGQIRNSRPLLKVEFTKDDQRFGLAMIDQHDPKNPLEKKRLTFAPDGATNNTLIKIDNYEYYFGGTQNPKNRWVGRRNQEKVKDRAWESTMRFGDQGVDVTQTVLLVPGQTGDLDTCLVYYTLWNRSKTDHTVELRVMLDTYIGANDGVPFTVPGTKGFLDKMQDFSDKKMPDYIEAVENPDDPKNPGTIARLGLKGIRLPGFNVEEATRLVVCRYPGNPQQGWDWPFAAMDSAQPKDSCVVLYWGAQKLNRNDTRHVGFTYGRSTLGGAGGTGGGALALSVPPNVYENTEFIVTAYVYDAVQGQKVSLELPDGLSLADGESADKTVDETAKRTTVFWRVRTGKAGTHDVKARSEKAGTSIKVSVKAKSIFG